VAASPFLAAAAPQATTGLIMPGTVSMPAPDPIVLPDVLPQDGTLFDGMRSDEVLIAGGLVDGVLADDVLADATQSATGAWTNATQATPTLATATLAMGVPDLIALPDVTAPSTDPWMDATGLMAVANPIVLPDYTVPGDETAALMLPAAPEISHLPGAFAALAHRLTTRAPAVISFVDPVTGEAADHSLSAGGLHAQDQAWLLVDPGLGHNVGAVSSRIRWDSHPP
jgi:hypothetical protein